MKDNLEVIDKAQARIGYLQIATAALIWGTYGLFVRNLDYSPEYILFYRFLFGFSGIFIFTLLRSGFASLKPALVHWKWLLLPAILTCLSWLAYTYAINLTSVANAAFLIYTAPVFTVLFAPIILKESLEKRTIMALVISLVGTGFLMGYSSLSVAGPNVIGDMIALFGGMTYGFLALLLKRMPAGVLGLPSNVVLSGFVALSLLPFILFTMTPFSWSGILILMALGLFQQAFGASMFHLGLKKVKAQHAGILTYVEPLAATVMAALFLYEGITWGSLVGGVLIVTGGLLIVLRRDPEEAPLPIKAGK